MIFKVIDKKTGKEPTNRVIDNIAKNGGLMTMDIDQFYVGEDGSLVLADDCGNITYCDTERFEVIAEQEPKTGWIPVSERLPEADEYIGSVAKYYLVQNEFGDMLVARYKHSGYWEQIYQLKPIGDEIVAWMPLPVPYKEG